MMYRVIRYFALPVILLCSISNVSFADSDKQLVIASSNNFPPINMLDSSEQLTGFARDLSSAVLKNTGYTPVYIHSPNWLSVVDWLSSGKADLIHDTGYTKEREPLFDFSDPIIEMSEVIFTRKETLNINSLISLYEKKVACVNQHITHIYLQKHPEINCYMVNTPVEGLIALAHGNVDALVYPREIISYLIQELRLNDQIRVTGSPLRELKWTMTVKRGNKQVLDIINRGLRQVKESGEYDRIYQHWFGAKLLAGYNTREVSAIVMASSVITLLLGMTIGLMFYARRLKLVQKKIQATETSYRTLIDNLPLRVFLKDINSVYLSCNQKHADDLGIAASQIKGMTDEELYPELAKEYRKTDLKVIDEKITFEKEEHHVKNGRHYTLHTITTPVFDAENNVSAILGIFWDITDRKKTETELATQKAFFQAVYHSNPYAIVITSLERTILNSNNAAQTLFGCSDNKCTGKNIDILFEAQTDGSLQDNVFGNNRHNPHTTTSRCRNTTGEVFPVEVHKSVIVDQSENIIGYIYIFKDITDLQNAEHEREQLQRQLLQAQKMEAVGQLTGGIAHDFNNILATMMGFATLGITRISKKETDKLNEYLTEIYKAGERASDMISKLLTFSRNRKGHITDIDAQILVAEVIQMLRPTIASTISLNKHMHAKCHVSADYVQLQQALMNLIINSRDAVNGKGNIDIHLDEQYIFSNCSSCHEAITSKYAIITVTDDGEGIPADSITKIFDPFFTSKKEGKGTGMGLSMVHGIIHNAGGHIIVNSEPGHGTVIKMLLPVSCDGEQMQNTETAASEKEQTSMMKTGHHVLVIDDDIFLSNYISELFTSWGIEGVVFNNSSTALEYFRNNPHKIDLVVTDQTMPTMTGIELAREIIRIRPDASILLMSGYTDVVNEETALAMGLKGFLNKPFKASVLKKQVFELMQQSAQSDNKSTRS